MMKSNRPISKRDMDELDEHLAGQDFSDHPDAQQNVWNLRQYISPSCYGHDLRQCNIPLPRLPKCYSHQVQQVSSLKIYSFHFL